MFGRCRVNSEMDEVNIIDNNKDVDGANVKNAEKETDTQRKNSESSGSRRASDI